MTVTTERGDRGAFKFIGAPHWNDPAVTTAFEAALAAMVEGPVQEQSIEVSFPASFTEYRIEGRHVRAGWLRAAYLVAFAKLGYRYALRALMTPVRKQIADPTGAHIDRFYLLGAQEPPDRQRMIVVAAPRSLRSVSVLMGRHLVFLPGIHGDSDRLYERLADRARWPPRRLRTLKGPVVDWPSMPELALDFA